MWHLANDAKKRWKVSGLRIAGVLGVLMLLLVVVISGPRPNAHAATGDWPTYLGNIARSGYNGPGGSGKLNTTSAPNLKVHWANQAAGPIASEPVEANGLIYWGSWDGLEHATAPATGTDAWTVNLGQTTSCFTSPVGVQSTATVATVSIGGVATPVVYVGGGDAQLYALNANSGAIIWHTPLGSSPSHFLYSSPAVFNGSVYIGVSSANDCPLVQGQMVQLSVSTGKVQHTFNVVPNGCLGGSVWGSPTIDKTTGMLYFATGNLGKCFTPSGAGQVIELSASNLSLVASWQVPSTQATYDGDFGSTPTLFQATISGVAHNMVGLVNKNSWYYAFDRSQLSAGPLWQDMLARPGVSPDLGQGSISSSAFDGTRLYVGAAKTTIHNVSCAGSVRALDPATGHFLWQVCLTSSVLAPIVTISGLVIVGAGPDMFVFDASTGKTLFNYHDTNANANFWGAASISNNVIYMGNMDGNLYAFGL